MAVHATRIIALVLLPILASVFAYSNALTVGPTKLWWLLPVPTTIVTSITCNNMAAQHSLPWDRAMPRIGTSILPRLVPSTIGLLAQVVCGRVRTIRRNGQRLSTRDGTEWQRTERIVVGYVWWQAHLWARSIQRVRVVALNQLTVSAHLWIAMAFVVPVEAHRRAATKCSRASRDTTVWSWRRGLLHVSEQKVWCG